jgi:hypothetical protein
MMDFTKRNCAIRCRLVLDLDASGKNSPGRIAAILEALPVIPSPTVVAKWI